MGRSAEEGEEVGASWTNVLLGRVNSDFTITGDWAVVSIGEKYCEETPAQCSNSRGTLTLKIDFVETAQGERVRLVLQALTMLGTSNAGIGSFPTGIWVRPGDEVLFDLSVN